MTEFRPSRFEILPAVVKNLLIINQISSVLPPNASGLDLNRSILEFLMNDSRSNLHELVSEALSYEAKKLL